MVRSVSIEMIAPIFCRTQIRSSISGSTAALRQFGDALGEHRGQQHLLGRADRGVRQPDLGAAQPLRGLQVLPVRPLLDDRAELPQHLEVEVDRPAADVAAAQTGDEGVAEAVQQRPAEQDRDAGRAGVGVDVGDVGALHVRGVEHQLARPPRRGRRSPRAAAAARGPPARRGCRARCAAGSGSLPSSAATMAFGTRFFAPRTRISPSSGVPPWTSRTSSSVMRLAFLERDRTGKQGAGAAARVCGHGAAHRPEEMVMRAPPRSRRPRYAARATRLLRCGRRGRHPLAGSARIPGRPARAGRGCGIMCS